jgi:hypothetical protein
MVFDYLMRPGVAPTTNVPFLLKAVGLPCATWFTRGEAADTAGSKDTSDGET